MKLSTIVNIIFHAAASSALAQRGKYGRTLYVKTGQKIQDVIKSAPSGSEIVIPAGTYPENLVIRKDGIRLRGEEGAILAPPATFERNNACSGNLGGASQAGICIAGSGIAMDPFIAEHRKVTSVKRPVKDVSVSGLQVKPQPGFQGANILVLGAERARIEHNTLVDGPAYGMLASGSKDTWVDGNIITSSNPAAPGIIALCMDNLSGAYGTNNIITFYAIGLCVQTDRAELRKNDVSFTCRAAFCDPYVQGIRLIDNHFHNSYNECGPFGSYAVTLAGTKDALVKGNLIEEIHNNGPAGGVYLVDDPCTDGSLACSEKPGVLVIAEGNKVVGNTFKNNDVDIVKDSQGRKNVVAGNKCTTSTPDGLC